MAFDCLILSGGFAAAFIWQSVNGSVVPWVVQVVAAATGDYDPSDLQIAFHRVRFIEKVRSIPADAIIVRQNWLRAYEFTTDRSALALNDYARSNDPLAKVGKQQVTVEVSSVIRASPGSFRVAWVERHYENGQLSATERWAAILTIVIQPPRDTETLRVNPPSVMLERQPGAARLDSQAWKMASITIGGISPGWSVC